MIDFATKAFFELYTKQLCPPDFEDRGNYSILHIGQSKINDWKAIREFLDHENVNERPENILHFYELLGFTDVDLVWTEEIDNWSNTDKKYDFIFDCHSADRILDQIKFMETINRMSKDQSTILHVLPYNSVFELGYYSFNPIYFSTMARHFNYDIIQSYIGSMDVMNVQKLNILDDFATEQYNTRYHINCPHTPTQGFEGPIFISAAFRKSHVQEDD